MADWSSKFQKFDFYPKIVDDFKIQTFSGAAVSIFAFVFILTLFVSELFLFMQIETVHNLHVDTIRGEKLRINFDVSFPRIPCSLLSLDAMDVSGNHQLDVDHDIKKKKITPDGKVIDGEEKHDMTPNVNGQPLHGKLPDEDVTKKPGYCGSCYGAEERPGQCCNTCDEVKEVYKRKGWAIPALSTIEQCHASGHAQLSLKEELEEGQGCRMYGFLLVNKVAGNFHFAPGKSFQNANMHVHDLHGFDATQFNVSHVVHHLQFGEPYPGLVNPLDHTNKTMKFGGGMVMYYTKVVPTSFAYLDGNTVNTNQFSVTEHIKPAEVGQQQLPGVFFFFELSPIMVQFQQKKQGFLHFLTQLCAIIGGVFTVAGMIDKLLHTSIQQFRKIELGKDS